MSVKIYWGGASQEKDLEAGSYEAQKGQIPQDAIETIHIPFGWTVFAYRDFGFNGPVTTLPGTDPLNPQVYNMKDHGLANAVSCLRIASNVPEGMDMNMDF